MERVSCALCGREETEVVATKGDLTADITNVMCRQCGLVFISPRPTVAEYEQFHVADFLAERHNIRTPDDVAHKVSGADRALKETVVDFLGKRIAPGLRVLDIGCGIGTVLAIIKERVPDAQVEGIELAEVDVVAAKQFYGLNLFSGSLGQYVDAHPHVRFDVIILHHTFEHLPEPRRELARMKGLLAPSGALYIAVPNIMDIRKRPEIFFQVGHPYSYSPATLRRMVEAEGFGMVAFHAAAGFPGGMEALMEARPTTTPELPASATVSGNTPAAVAVSVRSVTERFARMRGWRDRLLFFLPITGRIAVTRWFYLLLKRRSSGQVMDTLPMMHIPEKNWRGWKVLGMVGASLIIAGLFDIRNILLLWDAMSAGATYTYFTFLSPDALANLTPMIRDGLDGAWRVSDGRLAEHVQDPNLWTVLMPAMFKPFLWAVPSVPIVFLLFRIVAVAATYVLLVALVRRLLGSRRAAMILVAVFLLAPLLWYMLPPISLDYARMAARTLTPFGSPPGEVLLSKYNSLSVAPGLPLMALALLLVWAAIRRRTAGVGFLAGLSIGVMTTAYVTHGMYAAAIAGIACLLLAVQRQTGALRTLLWLACGTAVGAAPFIWNYIHIQALPSAAELFMRLGGDHTRAIRWSEWFTYVVYAVFAVGTFWVARRKSQEHAAFLTAGVLAAIAVLNIQVVIGFNPEPTVWRIHQLFFGFFLAWTFLGWQAYRSIHQRLGKRGWIVTAFVLALCGMIAGRAIYANIYAFSYARGLTRLPASYAAAFDWLNSHTPEDAVVVSPSLATNTLLPTFTHNRVLIGKAVTAAAPEWELVDRLLLSYQLFGVPAEHLEAGLRKQVTIRDPFFQTTENDLVTYLYEYRFISTKLNGFYHGASRAVPDEVVAELVGEYRAYPRRLGYLLNRYQMDYLFVGPMERQLMQADFSSLPYLIMVYSQDGIQIYQIDRSKI